MIYVQGVGPKIEVPSAICIDSCTLQSTVEHGGRAGQDGAKRRKGSKVYLAVDTLTHLLALTITPFDQGDTRPNAAVAAQHHATQHTLEVVKRWMAKHGFLLLSHGLGLCIS